MSARDSVREPVRDPVRDPTRYQLRSSRSEARQQSSRIKSDPFIFLEEQVHSDNDVSEVDILGHFGTFWYNSEDFLTSLDHLDCFPSHFRPFSSIISSFKKTRDGPTDR